MSRLQRKLTAAFRRGGWNRVKELHRGDVPRENCWYSGAGWWLSIGSMLKQAWDSTRVDVNSPRDLTAGVHAC